MKLKKYIFILSFYFLFPLVAIELFSQFKFLTGYVYNFFYRNKNYLKEHGFQNPNQRLINEYKLIYPDYNKTKFIKFNTDKYGTIKPSSLQLNRNIISESILFCGGSSTEGVAIKEGKRVPDIFSSISKIPSINAGTSGKNLEGCIKTINFVLTRFGKPRKIIIATNVNTLSQFVRIESGQLPTNTNQKVALSPQGIVRNSFKAVLPGTYWSLGEIKRNFQKTTPKKKIIPFSPLTDFSAYEIALSKGCCYWPSYFNRTNDSHRFDWVKDENLQDYYKFASQQGKSLINLLAIKNYPLTNIVIFIEPNSFLNKATSGFYDFRQFLTSIDGKLLKGSESAEIIEKYDNEYYKALKKLGFRGLKIDSINLHDEYFYDAVHLSPTGSEFIGKFYSDHIK